MLELDRSLVEEIGFNPYYYSFDNKKYIDLASNNYLGLAENEKVKESAIDAIRKYGTSMCGTPIATGYIELFEETERRLSEFVNLDQTIIFPSCYQANNGIFGVLANKEDIIIFDRFAHSSLIQGIKAVGCKISPFLHNDMNHLEQILSRSQSFKQLFVVTESVFSTEGSIAPFKEIDLLCKKYNAVPIVDDSHAIGVIGKDGKGILQYQSITDFNGIYTASLGKAFANNGGMVAGNNKTIEYLRHYCPQLIYSTAIAPASLGGINGVLDVLAADFEELSSRMWRYKNLIYNSIDNIIKSEAPINSINTGTAKETILLSKKLFENGILSTPFIEPSVPKNEGIVRLIAGAGLSEEQIKCVVEKIKNISL